MSSARVKIPERWTPDDYRQRPRDYDPTLADEILLRISNGELLPSICSENRDLPLPGTFLEWCETDPILAADYAKARSRGSEIMVDEMVTEAWSSDMAAAHVRSRALERHAVMTDPSRYGPRATVKVKEGEDDDGVDYRSEVRRKIDSLSEKLLAAQTAAEAQDS